MMQALSRDFYDRDTVLVARELLGKYLVHVVGGVEMIGKIVEVEAYIGPHDLASHAFCGLTPRTQMMFGMPGFAYVYLIYGIYHCFNVVTEKEGYAAAVLIRALEPIQNIISKTNGPGLLCRAMQIDRTHHGYDLLSHDLYIAKACNELAQTIVKRPRIGVAYAGVWAKKLLRFYIRDNVFVSRR